MGDEKQRKAEERDFRCFKHRKSRSLVFLCSHTPRKLLPRRLEKSWLWLWSWSQTWLWSTKWWKLRLMWIVQNHFNRDRDQDGKGNGDRDRYRDQVRDGNRGRDCWFGSRFLIAVVIVYRKSFHGWCLCATNTDDTKFLPSSFFRRGSLLVACSLQSPSPECFSSSGLPRKRQAVLKEQCHDF